MQRFHNILVIAPGNVDARAAIQAADDLAVRNGGRLTIFDSAPPVRASRSGRIGKYRADDIQEMVSRSLRSRLEESAAGCRAPTEVEVATGPLFIEAIRRVMREEHDLVVIAPDQEVGSTGLSRASTTMHLLRKCPVPVWVHRSDIEAGPDVLAAVGPFPGGSASELDHLILALGSSLAAQMQGDLHVVHAWDLAGEAFLRGGRVEIPSEAIDELIHEERMLAQLEVEKLLVDTGLYDAGVSVHLLPGAPPDVITTAAATVQPGVVVMGTLARSGIAGLLIGNTAEAALSTVTTSVLAVKPDDFESPVRI